MYNMQCFYIKQAKVKYFILLANVSMKPISKRQINPYNVGEGTYSRPIRTWRDVQIRLGRDASVLVVLQHHDSSQHYPIVTFCLYMQRNHSMFIYICINCTTLNNFKSHIFD